MFRSIYNAPDPSAALGLSANGNVGVSWTYQILNSGATLYLIDHGNGGQGANAATPARILARIPVTAANGGWQRLRLELGEKSGVASFGGQLGCADGSTYAFESTRDSWPVRTFYVGYREFLTNNTTARPVTLDAVTLRRSTSASTSFGTAKATTKGTPSIRLSSPASIGNSEFAIVMSGLVPSSANILVMGPKLAVPVDVATIGGQAGSSLYVLPSFSFAVANSASGAARALFPLPCVQSLLGVTVSWQCFDVDPALTVALKLGNSAAIETRIGN